MTWRWLPSGETGYQVYTADSLTGPYSETGRSVALWPYGQTASDHQYGHTLYGAYPALNGNMLMVWSNNAGFNAGILLARSRPTFTTFNPIALTADAPAV